MTLKNLNNIEILTKNFKLNKILPLNGHLKVIEPLGNNRWLVAFLGKKLEIKASLPLKPGFNYKANLHANKSGNLEIKINFDSIYKEIEQFDLKSNLLIKKGKTASFKTENSLLSNILDNVKDEFILKFLFKLQFEDIPEKDFYEIYDYLENKKFKSGNSKTPIFIDNSDEFIIALPFIFLDLNGIFFLFSNKQDAKVSKWSFVYFFSDKQKIISVFNKLNERDTNLIIYSDIDISDIVEQIKQDLAEFNIKDVSLVNSVNDLDGFDFEIIKHKGINFKI